MTTETSDQLIPLAELRQLLEDLMKDRSYMGREPFIRRGEDGAWTQHQLPAGEGLTLQHFLAAVTDLPDPAPASLAGPAITGVLGQRGHHFLINELLAMSEERWPDPAARDSVQQDAAEWMPRCGWCGKPVNDQRAKWCSRSHRQQAYKRRKREQG